MGTMFKEFSNNNQVTKFNGALDMAPVAGLNVGLALGPELDIAPKLEPKDTRTNSAMVYKW